MKRKKILMFLAVPLAMILAIVAYRSRPLDVEREFGPFPALPNPNAYDGFLNAHRQIQVVNSQFARRDKQAVAPLLDYGDTTNKIYPSQTRAQWLAQNRAGFAAFDAALKLPFQFPVFKPKSEFPGRDEDYKFRFLAKFKAVQSQTLAEKNDHFGAAHAAIDAIEMGVKMRNQASVSDSLTAAVCESYGRQALETEIAALNTHQAQILAKRLEKINAARPLWPEVLRAEKLQGALDIEHGLAFPLQKALERPDSSSISPLRARLIRPFINATIRNLIGKLHRGIDAQSENAKSAWPNRQTLPNSSDAAEKLVAKMVESRFFYERSKTMAHQLQIRLALHSFRKTNGVYPRDLSELSPRFLKIAPLDTFANAPMKYQVVGKKYKLWSVGPDARDDGARPIENSAAKTKTARFLVKKDSSGDILAGLNR